MITGEMETARHPGHRGCLIVNSIGELVGVNAALGGTIEEAVRGAVHLYERIIRQAAEQGESDKPRDVRATARAFVAFVSGLNTISKVIRDEGELWWLCDGFLELYGFRSSS